MVLLVPIAGCFPDWAVAQVVRLVVVVLGFHLHYYVVCILGHSVQGFLVLHLIGSIVSRLRVVLPVLNEKVFLIFLVIVALGPGSLVLAHGLALVARGAAGLVDGVKVDVVVVVGAVVSAHVVEGGWLVHWHEVIHHPELLLFLLGDCVH